MHQDRAFTTSSFSDLFQLVIVRIVLKRAKSAGYTVRKSWGSSSCLNFDGESGKSYVVLFEVGGHQFRNVLRLPRKGKAMNNWIDFSLISDNTGKTSGDTPEEAFIQIVSVMSFPWMRRLFSPRTVASP